MSSTYREDQIVSIREGQIVIGRYDISICRYVSIYMCVDEELAGGALRLTAGDEALLRGTTPEHRYACVHAYIYVLYLELTPRTEVIC